MNNVSTNILAATLLAISLASCSEARVFPQTQGIIIVSDPHIELCTATIETETLNRENRLLFWNALIDEPNLQVFRSNFPDISEIGVFLSPPCAPSEIDSIVSRLTTPIVDSGNLNITLNSGDYIVQIPNFTTMSLQEKIDAIQLTAGTGGSCSVKRVYDEAYDYMIAALNTLELVRRTGFPIIDVHQTNNEIRYTFYIPCSAQINEYIDYIDKSIIYSDRIPIGH